MIEGLFSIGAAVGFLLVALLVLTISGAGTRIWPVPVGFNLRSMTFWSLFRGLNLFAIVIGLVDFAPLEGSPLLARILGGTLALCCLAAYLFAGAVLGREKLYCGGSGLETGGLYRFSRNPQYAAAMPGFVGFSVAAWSMSAALIAGLLASVYMLMALAEEPWLERAYGAAYDRYRKRVPRFYHVRRILALLHLAQVMRPRA
ncbi:MAG: methyltransferase [Hyphomicrobium sp.]